MTDTAEVFQFPAIKQETKRVASLDEGYFRIATSIGNLKPKMSMSGTEHQVFDAIIMCTFGWNKSEDKVTNTYLAEMTELDDSDINKILNKLANRKFIILRKSGGFKLVSINKKLDEWLLKREKPKKLKTPTKLGEITHKDGCFNRSSWGKSPNTKDSLTKDNNINNLTSENSNESSDRPSEKVLAVKPDAVVSTPKGDKWGNADDLKAAKWIYKRVLIVSPTAKEPTWSGWANDVRLMRQLDERTHEQICKLFKWANKDSFWCSNVLSPAKLREKWSQLEAKRNTQQPTRTQASCSHIDFDNTDWAEGLEV